MMEYTPCPQNCEPWYTPFLPLSCFFSGIRPQQWEREWINQALESRDALSCHFEHCTSHFFYMRSEPFAVVYAHCLLWIWAALQSHTVAYWRMLADCLQVHLVLVDFNHYVSEWSFCSFLISFDGLSTEATGCLLHPFLIFCGYLCIYAC